MAKKVYKVINEKKTNVSFKALIEEINKSGEMSFCSKAKKKSMAF